MIRTPIMILVALCKVVCAAFLRNVAVLSDEPINTILAVHLSDFG